ncbi:MAG: hypothetical protein IT178_06590 [Acidobacteria bacterium]|nr:hypothetical protein [Acidobacteriota bacterium]
MTRRRALPVAISVAAVYNLAITLWPQPGATGSAWFVVLVTVVTVMPYAVLMIAAALATGTTWPWVATTVYGIVDAFFRTKGLWFPSGSTDSLIVLFLPTVVAPVTFVLAWAATRWWHMFRERSG